MRGPRRPKYFAGEAVLQLDGVVLDHDLLRSRRRPVSRPVADDRLNLDLLLDVSGLVLGRPRQDPGIAETGFEQV